MTTLKAIDRKTGAEVNATRTEEGKFAIEGGKTYSASTFKKYYKLTGETSTKVEPKKEEEAPKKEAAKTAKKVKTAKKAKVVKVEYTTFTGMVIGKDTFGDAIYEATVTDKGYTMETKRHGVQKFDKNGIQLGCKNPKFANRIKVIE